jgi:drug/metabolite transporter, DME family
LRCPSESPFALSGTFCCLLSASAYTAVDICMRKLTELQCDPFWAVFNKELVAVVVVGPWLLYQAARGRPALPGGRILGSLLLVGLLVQLIGNVGMQWALGVVGLAVTIPVVFAMMITSGAILGRFWLGEQVSVRSVAAIGVLLASLALLALGAEAVGRSIAADQPAAASVPLAIALGLAAAAAAGVVFTLLSISIRHTATRTNVSLAVALLVPLVGVVMLGPICVVRCGMQSLLATPPKQILLMAAAGVFNLIGFLALIHGLKLTTVVRANVLSASQVAMAATAGMAMFREPPNPWLLLGIGLTVFGILSIDRPEEAVDEILPP